MTGIASTLAVANRLAALIEEENQLLIDRRPSELAENQDEKADLSLAYQQELDALRAQPETLASAAPEEVAALKAAGMRLVQAMDIHRRKILAARTVAERIIKAVTDEVAKRSNPLQGYTAGAVLKERGGANSQSPTSLAFHEVV